MPPPVNFQKYFSPICSDKKQNSVKYRKKLLWDTQIQLQRQNIVQEFPVTDDLLN